jgi:energy-coupling factor transporter ATP-binding protein EcfA2
MGGRAEKVLRQLVAAWPRWAGVACGPPGSGKTTFLKALHNVAQREGLRALFLRVKDCDEESYEVEVPEGERYLVSRVSSILHFTVERGFRVSLDLLQEASASSIGDLMEWAERNYPADIARWIKLRLKMLQRFLDGSSRVVLPLCLKRHDEGARRLALGLLYALRPLVACPVLLDDALGFVLNERYGEAWTALMRPYIVSVNRYLETREILAHAPVIIAPCEVAVYRFCSRGKYVIMWNKKLNEVSFEEIRALADGHP